MFSIIIPLFNEDKNIISLLDEIVLALKNYKDFEIVLIDDCSNDNTFKIINSYNNYKRITIIQNNFNKGQSFSLYKGISNASFDTIITLDGDGQNNPFDIPKKLKIYNNQETKCLVGGIRVKRKDNIVKILSSRIANSIRSFILNDNCKDTGCSLKVFSKKEFNKLPYFNGIHRFLPALFKNLGCKLLFERVDHRKRKFGYSKYGTFDRLVRGIRDLFLVLRIINSLKKIKND